MSDQGSEEIGMAEDPALTALPHCTPVQPLSVGVCKVSPLEQVAGFVTETILGTIPLAPEDQGSPTMLTKQDMEDALVEGIIKVRCRGLKPEYKTAVQKVLETYFAK